MDCRILHLLEGAKEATGIAVIIDVFRAFSVECYLYEMGATLVRPVGTIEEARALHEMIPGSILVGERKGIRCEGFDFGNSPSQIVAGAEKVKGRVAIHTTSAGTQGIVNATGAREILTGSLVNAKAVATYIHKRLAEASASAFTSENLRAIPVSLVAMGLSAERRAAEDELCAEYICAYLEGKEIPPSYEERRQNLKDFDGKRFFDPDLQEHFPEEDYHMCIKESAFPYVLRIGRDDLGYFSERVFV
ncbi:MAG: 2-phosphosulfolactate phosphatase [Clostridiales bacterium]|nr:2-phosphosulfolactate phosphatase [Clostridiales bacterium]